MTEQERIAGYEADKKKLLARVSNLPAGVLSGMIRELLEKWEL